MNKKDLSMVYQERIKTSKKEHASSKIAMGA